MGPLPLPEAVRDFSAWPDGELEYGMFSDEYDLGLCKLIDLRVRC